MTQYPTPHDPCPICGRPHAAHDVLDTLRCIEELRQRNQAARVVEFERLYQKQKTAN
jgi:predicted nucleic acid-binding Zn ribbon protein